MPVLITDAFFEVLSEVAGSLQKKLLLRPAGFLFVLYFD
jgi:hypothetical protein